MALFNNSDEVIFVDYFICDINEVNEEERESFKWFPLKTEFKGERVAHAAGSFQEFNLHWFSNPSGKNLIRVVNNDGNFYLYLWHPDTGKDYIVARDGDRRLRVHRVYKCSAKEEPPYELYLRHNLALQDYATYFKILNSGIAHKCNLGDNVFLPEFRDFKKCKDCKIVPSHVRKQAQEQEIFFAPKTLIEGVEILYQWEAGTDPEFDVLFIHGLQYSVGKEPDWWRAWSMRGGDKVECWPQKWLPRVFPKARVLALSYNSSLSSERVPLSPMGLWKRAIGSIDSLLSSGFGRRPYFLIGHSMGGLLAKEIILKGRKQIAEQCKGLVFYGVPHLGATAANFVTLVNTIAYGVPGISCLVEELQHFGKQCFKRNVEFEPYMNIPAYNFLESRKTICGRIFGLLPVKVMVVPAEIATYPGSRSCFVEADHHEVCQPAVRTDLNFAFLTSFFHERLSVGMDMSCFHGKDDYHPPQGFFDTTNLA